MNKIFFVFRLQFCKAFIWCAFYFSLVVLPCFLQANSFAEKSPVMGSIIEKKDIFKAVIPHFISLGRVVFTVPPNVIFKNKQSVNEFPFCSDMITVQIKNDGNSRTDNNTTNTRKKTYPVHITILSFLLGSVIGLVLVFIFLYIFLRLEGKLHLFGLGSEPPERIKERDFFMKSRNHHTYDANN